MYIASLIASLIVYDDGDGDGDGDERLLCDGDVLGCCRLAV